MKKSEYKNLRSNAQKMMRFFSNNSCQTPCGAKISSSSAHILLLLLKMKDEVVNQQVLAKELGLNKSSIARSCTELEENGHLKIDSHQEDRRSNVIVLTSKGIKLARKLEDQGDAFFTSVLKNIPSEKVDVILESIEIFVKALEVASKNEGNREK